MSTYRLAREFCLHTGTGSSIANTFILLTIVFALAFPTFVSSIAGYVTDTGPYIQVLDGNMVLFKQFENVGYILHDGHRVNLTEEYIAVHGTNDGMIRSHYLYNVGAFRAQFVPPANQAAKES